MYFDPLWIKQINYHLILGNHDLFWKTKNDVSGSVMVLNEYSNIVFFKEPQDVILEDGTSIAYVPWICKENEERSLEFIKKSFAPFLFGHLEIKGFNYNKVMQSIGGRSVDIFKQFDKVASGHYHSQQKNGNIHYLGSPFQKDWGDEAELRGFHIFDTQTREWEFIPNPYDLYIKFKYDDKDMTIEQMMSSIDKEMYKDKFVKLIIINKKNPFIYDQVFDELEKSGAIEVEPVEDHMNIVSVNDEDIIEADEDKVTSLHRYVDAVNFGIDNERLKNKLTELYTEAQFI